MRRRAPKGMTGVFKERTPVDSVLLAEDIVRDLQNHPLKRLRHAALDYEIDTGTLIKLLEKHHPNGRALADEFRLRGGPHTKRLRRTVTIDRLVPAKPNDPTPEPAKPPATFPFVLRYRAQHHGTVMLVDPSQVERERMDIAQERGWNFHFIALYPISRASG